MKVPPVRWQELGKLVYEAYVRECGMRDAPPWEDLAWDQKRGWIEAACAVMIATGGK